MENNHKEKLILPDTLELFRLVTLALSILR